LSTEAKVAAANGVYAAAEGAAAINFATRLVSPSMATPITTGALLIAAMDGTPKGWAPSGATISDSTSTYHIGITTGEGPGNKAKLAKSGF
ncbi:MAG: prepilin-type cleavage/methylation domain-containing protein, partial [Proteobacteria bacterium]|nr:prepilin-type cleavage/methylation domain-containing protein [Pseudomonadota bacterium]